MSPNARGSYQGDLFNGLVESLSSTEVIYQYIPLVSFHGPVKKEINGNASSSMFQPLERDEDLLSKTMPLCLSKVNQSIYDWS